MWALRRASLPLRNQAFNIRSSRACCANLELPITYGQEDACFHESCKSMPDGCLSSKRFYYTTKVSWNFSVDRRSFSSQAGAESSGEEDDLEDGFSELETPSSAEASQHEDELISESELSEDEEEIELTQHELELSENEADSIEKRSPRKRNVSALFKAILAFPGFAVQGALDKWVKAGNDLNRAEISLAMLNFRKRQMFGLALPVLNLQGQLDEARVQLACTVTQQASMANPIEQAAI